MNIKIFKYKATQHSNSLPRDNIVSKLLDKNTRIRLTNNIHKKIIKIPINHSIVGLTSIGDSGLIVINSNMYQMIQNCTENGPLGCCLK